MQEFRRNVLIYVSLNEFLPPFVNYAIFRELCDRMPFEVDCAKSHHRVISEGLIMTVNSKTKIALTKKRI